MQVSKYNANGNDFIIYHTFAKKDHSDEARKICNRQYGIGADGLIVLLPHDRYNFEWQFYNSDGSNAHMCGNGSRAAAHYAYTNSLAPSSMSFLTEAGVIEAEVEHNMVQSDLTSAQLLDQDIIHNTRSWWLIDTGVPHLVAIVEDIVEFDLKEARELRERYDANVNIAYILDDTSIKVRTYERGVEAETLACGTGMAACFFRALKEKKVSEQIRVYPKSNETLYLSQESSKIRLKGEVELVFTTDVVKFF